MTSQTIRSVDSLDEIDAAAREQAMKERITRVLGDGFCGLADYLKTGQPDDLHPLPELIEHATAVAEVLSQVDPQAEDIDIGDEAVPKTAHLLYSLLNVCREVGRIESEVSIARHKALMAAEREGGSDE